MRYHKLLLLVCAALCVQRAVLHAQSPAGSPRPDKTTVQTVASTSTDATPPGMVAFFMTETCPEGWVIPDKAPGRLIVGVTDPSAVGVTKNPALSNGATPAHDHVYATTVKIGSKKIALANGSNKQGARHGNYPVNSVTDAATLDLPFIQLTICQKQ
jgi:hypothetical protein